VSSMELQFLPGQNYDCVRCAKGCHPSSWRIHVDPYSQRQIQGSQIGLRVIQENGGPPFQPFHKHADGATIMSPNADGKCFFLQGDNLCGLHAEAGIDAKPIGCRQFPFLIRPSPDGVVVGVSFYCTSVQQNSGRPLDAHADEIREIIKRINFKPVGEGPIPVYGEVTTDWGAYKQFEQFLAREMESAGPELATGRCIYGLSAAIHRNGNPLTADKLMPELETAPPEALERDGIIHAQNEFFVAAMVAMLEAADPGKCPELTEALLQGRDISLARFGWKGSALDVERREQDMRDRFENEITRYLRALLHRKFLILERPLLDNLAILYLVPRMLRYYTALANLARGAPEPEIADYFRALDVVEGLATHAHGLDVLYTAFGESLYKQTVAIIDRQDSADQ